MDNKVLHQFVKKYFEAYHADILFDDNRKLQVQLTEDLDKELMNRPFYWEYVKKINGQAQPMTLTFFTDGNKDKNEKGEPLHFGSPRLHQIFQSAKQKGTWTLLYEEKENTGNPSPLYPWLVANVKISYSSYQRKDCIRSFGLQLIHGQLVDNMMEFLNGQTFRPVIPDHSFPMKSLIHVNSGLARIKRHIEHSISSESHTWADDANLRMQEELKILDAYYQSSSQPEEEYLQEKKAIKERYHPKILVDVINYGLFYISDSSL